MVLCPRMEWYTLLASNKVMQKYVRTINNPFNKSALSEGCNGLHSVTLFQRRNTLVDQEDFSETCCVKAHDSPGPLLKVKW